MIIYKLMLQMCLLLYHLFQTKSTRSLERLDLRSMAKQTYPQQ
jgi:hypothetical protein